VNVLLDGLTTLKRIEAVNKNAKPDKKNGSFLFWKQFVDLQHQLDLLQTSTFGMKNGT
jgi:hypothetical protein